MGRVSYSVVALFVCFVVGRSTSRAAEVPDQAAQDAALVKTLMARWANVPAAEREAAEVVFQIQIPSRALPLFEAAIAGADVSAETRRWLQEVVNREREWESARQKLIDRRLPEGQWNMRTAVEAYEKFGNHSPKWDALAREGVRAYATIDSDAALAYRTLGKAIDAGCDDPFVLYLHARGMERFADNDDVDRRYAVVVDAIFDSGYPPSRKMMAIWKAFSFRLGMSRLRLGKGTPITAALQGWLTDTNKKFMDLWPDLVAERGVPESYREDLAGEIVTMYLPLHMDRRVFADWLIQPLEKAYPNSAGVQVLKGKFYIRYAWDARGSGLASTVTPQGWKLFAERLELARAALETAWKIDSTRYDIADEMVTVALGQGWRRADMEVWFNRAMKINPDDRTVCLEKLNFLQPKWHGSPEEMIRFGRECREKRNWAGDIATMLVEVHQCIGVGTGNEDAYWLTAGVWHDVRSCFEPRLIAWPKDNKLRSEYCLWACRTSQWDIAAREFATLADKANSDVFGGAEKMNKLKATAAAAAN